MCTPLKGSKQDHELWKQLVTSRSGRASAFKNPRKKEFVLTTEESSCWQISILNNMADASSNGRVGCCGTKTASAITDDLNAPEIGSLPHCIEKCCLQQPVSHPYQKQFGPLNSKKVNHELWTQLVFHDHRLCQEVFERVCVQLLRFSTIRNQLFDWQGIATSLGVSTGFWARFWKVPHPQETEGSPWRSAHPSCCSPPCLPDTQWKGRSPYSPPHCALGFFWGNQLERFDANILDTRTSSTVTSDMKPWPAMVPISHSHQPTARTRCSTRVPRIMLCGRCGVPVFVCVRGNCCVAKSLCPWEIVFRNAECPWNLFQERGVSRKCSRRWNVHEISVHGWMAWMKSSIWHVFFMRMVSLPSEEYTFGTRTLLFACPCRWESRPSLNAGCLLPPSYCTLSRRCVGGGGCVLVQRMALLVSLASPAFSGVKFLNFVGKNIDNFPPTACSLYSGFFNIPLLLRFLLSEFDRIGNDDSFSA